MKTIGILLGIALVYAMTSPAHAWFDRHQSSTTEFNSAFVTSTTESGAYTGGNTQVAGVSIEKAHVDDVYSGSRNSLTTGTATAESNSAILVNNTFGCNTCNRYSYGGRTTETNMAMVETATITEADTGLNIQQSGVTVDRAGVDDIRSCDSNRLTTGAATATSNSLTLVNVEWNHMMMPL